MSKDQAFALRQQVAEKTFVRLRKDRAGVSAQLAPLLADLETHLFDHDLTVETWMHRCRIRDRAIAARFSRDLGRAPWEYVTHHRMEVAATMLERSDLKPWRIAMVVGYASSDAFGRAFKRWAKCTPTDYRKRAGSPRPKVDPKPLVDLEELEQAMAGDLAPEPAEQLHRRLLNLIAQVETAYPELRAARAVAKPVVGAEMVEATLAEQLWSRLRTRPFEEQRALVKAQVAFSTSVLFELLLRKSREEGRKDRQRGVEVAKLALESLEAIEGLGDQMPNFRVRGWAWLGNAHRLAYELLDTERAFTTAEAEWDTILPKHRDEMAVAELWFFEGVLLTYQRHFDAALTRVNDAISILRLRADAPGKLIRVLLVKGTILRYKEDHRAVLEVLREADELVAQDNDPYLRLAIQANLANANIRIGLVAAARANLEKARPLSLEVGSRLTSLQLDWIEGLLEQRCGHFENARRKLNKAREDFRELGELGYFAVVSLDLAILCVNLGEVDAPLSIAAEVATVFEALCAHHGLLVALKLLRSGLAVRRISCALLEKARHLMEKVRPLGFGNLKDSEVCIERVRRDPLDTTSI